MWVVGIDEAGYGPNLGPLVQAAVGLHLPDDDPAGWETLKAVVRRSHDKADGRLLIDDSKKVYTRGGLEALEEIALGLFGIVAQPIEQFLGSHSPESLAALRNECWFDPNEQLPVVARVNDEVMGQWLQGYKFCMYGMHSSVVNAPRFNEICDETGSKGSVLAQGLIELLRVNRDCGGAQPTGTENHPILFLCDKHGGRNFYAAMIQSAFPEGWVVVERESAAESRYRVEHLDRPITVTFRPRADGDSVAVALASMVCKYLREVCMRQFNQFWAKHVPGIAPTAGYPLDAKRFYAEIQPAMAKLGITPDQVWRKR